MLRRIARRAVTWFGGSRLHRIERAAIAAEHLARIDDLDLVIARSEGFIRSLVRCDDARVSLGAQVPPSAIIGRGGGDVLRMPLAAAHGGRLGWLTAARREAPLFSADDEAVFEHLGRILTLAVQAAMRGEEAASAIGGNSVLLADMMEGVAEFDRHLNVLAVNRTAARMLGTGRIEDIRGTSLWDLGPGRAPGEFGTLCETALRSLRPLWAVAPYPSLGTAFDLLALPHARGLTVLFREIAAAPPAAPACDGHPTDAPPQETWPPTLAIADGPVPGRREMVLLVEDNALVRAHAAAVLRILGYEVTTAPDGPEALRALQEGARPDLLFADILLPGGMTGIELARAAVALLPGLPVLLSSGQSAASLPPEARLDPGMALLRKPFRRAELASAVRTQLARGQRAVPIG